MDGHQRAVKHHSLQQNLNRWIIIISGVFALLSGIISGVTAFVEAQESQDVILRQIGELVTQGRMSSITANGGEPEESLVVQRLETGRREKLPIAIDYPDGLYTLTLQGNQWRVFIMTAPKTTGEPSERFAIAQKTEYRNELAWNSCLHSFLAVLLLAPLLMGLAHLIIKHSFKPVRVLAKQIDKRLETDLTPLPEGNISQEIAPFVISINQLLLRINKVLILQRRFVSDAAHELRTPLTALSLLTENLTNAKDMEQAQQRLIPLREGVNRMQTLVTQLLSLARMQGKPPSEPHVSNMLQVVREIIAELHPLAEAKAIDLGMIRQENIILMDIEDGLALLLRNAIGNALCYTPEGGQIDVSLYGEDGKGILVIQDNGPGIRESELPHIFEPFRRASGTREAGNGLGLAISLEIARRLGGEIVLQNQPGGGLLFIYRQPLVGDGK